MKKWIIYIGIALFLGSLPNLNAYFDKHIESSHKTEIFKSKIVPFCIKYNSSILKIKKDHFNENTEIEFTPIDKGDLWIGMINEELGFSYEYIRENIFKNINDAEIVKSFSLTKEWKCEFNGIPLNCMRFDVDLDKSSLSYFYYVYTGQDCTFQLFGLYPKKSSRSHVYESIIEETVSNIWKS